MTDSPSDPRPGLGRDRPGGGRLRRWELILLAMIGVVALAATVSSLL